MTGRGALRTVPLMGVRWRHTSLDPAERELYAHDAYGSAMLLALLLLLWGVISLLFVREQVFDLSNEVEAVAGGAGLVYFTATLRRPNTIAAMLYSLAAIAFTLGILPWTAVVWCELGRPIEAFTVPEVGMVVMAFAIPRSVWLGGAVLVVLTGESAFALEYARRHAPPELLPLTEPFALIACSLMGGGLLLLREWRRRLAHQHIRAQAEILALGRVGPLFARIRNELTAQLPVFRQRDRSLGIERTQALTDRAIERLSAVSGSLDRLLELEAAPVEQGGPSSSEAERRLLANDARVAACGYLAMSLVLTLLGMLFPFPWASDASRLRWGGMVVILVGGLLFLWGARRRLSEDGILWTVLAVAVAALVLISLNQADYSGWNRPFEPFLGHKLTMVLVGLTVGHRLWLRASLIGLTALAAFFLYFALHLYDRRELIPLAEPWLTLVYMVVALAAAVLRDQRRLASLQQLRDEAEVSALQRRALLFLALRDQFNSPLQSLMLCQPPRPQEPPDAVQAGIARLAALSRQLAGLDARVHREGFDAGKELRPSGAA